MRVFTAFCPGYNDLTQAVNLLLYIPMSKLTEHLSKHLRGDVIDKKSALDYFSTDSSIFQVKPKAVVYPKDVTDVRKVSKFSWQLAERGKKLPVTTRGKGTDLGGGAIGEGLITVLPAYMNKLVDLDRETVSMEPGMLFGDLQRTLRSHGRFLPPYPASMEFSTVGGAVANNASGEKTIKYGSTADYVEELEVVLSNGQVIRTKPLSRRELNKKKGQTDLEGDIYRKVDGILIDNEELIENAHPKVSKNTAGYALWEIRRPDGTFDLSRLITGSQGTLGTVTEITFKTEPYNPDTHLVMACFDDIEKAQQAIETLVELKPSAMESVDYNLLNYLQHHHSEKLKSVIEGELPKLMLLVEFDEEKKVTRKRKAKKAQKRIRDFASEMRLSDDPEEQEDLWRVHRASAAIMWQEQGKKKPLPVTQDGIVPLDKTAEFLKSAYELFEKYNLEIAIWGHVGNANFHIQPFLDISDTSDRQTIFKLLDEYNRLLFNMGGSTSGEHNDGRLRAPYLHELYGNEIYELFRQVKEAFDPHGILNPGVKMNVSKDALRKQMRNDYTMDNLYEYMPQAHY